MPTEERHIHVTAEDGDIDAMRLLLDGVSGDGFKTVADMLASRRPYRRVGEIWRAAGFRYVVVDPSTPIVNGYPLLTLGGVKLDELGNADETKSARAYATATPADWGDPINRALADGQSVNLPNRDMPFTTPIVVPRGATLRGQGFNHSPSTSGGSRLIKDGAFAGVLLDGHNAGLEDITVEGSVGNTGDGVQVKGSRAWLRNVAAHNQGGDGVRVGTDTLADNSNFWRAEGIYTSDNGGAGLHISHQPAPGPDVNGGLLNVLEARGNGLDGLRIGHATDNTLLGVGCQFNNGYGARFMTGARANWMPNGYFEANVTGEVILDSGADQNKLEFWRYAQTQDSITDNGSGNLIFGKSSARAPSLPEFRNEVGFRKLLVLNPAISGNWLAQQSGTTRDLLLSLEDTSAGAHVRNADGGFGFLSGELIANVLRGGGSANFGTVAAHSTVNTTMTLTGALVADAGKYNIIANRNGAAMPSGIVISGGYISADGVATIQIGNVTASPIVVGSVSMVLTALKIQA